VRLDDEFFVIDDTCTHGEASLFGRRDHQW